MTELGGLFGTPFWNCGLACPDPRQMGAMQQAVNNDELLRASGQWRATEAHKLALARGMLNAYRLGLNERDNIDHPLFDNLDFCRWLARPDREYRVWLIAMIVGSVLSALSRLIR